MLRGTSRPELLAGISLSVLAAGMAMPIDEAKAQSPAGQLTTSCTNVASIGSITVSPARSIGQIVNYFSGTITGSGTITTNITTVVAGLNNNGTIGTLSNLGSITAV